LLICVRDLGTLENYRAGPVDLPPDVGARDPLRKKPHSRIPSYSSAGYFARFAVPY